VQNKIWQLFKKVSHKAIPALNVEALGFIEAPVYIIQNT
jgi:hypothetical protein